MKKINKKILLLLIAAVLVLTVSTGVTVAYLAAATEPVVNVFHPTTVTTDIEEDFTDTTEKKNVEIKNDSEIPVYVRAKVVGNWCDAAGNVVSAWTDNISYDSAWIKGSDGYYYHKNQVQPGGSALLFESYSYKTTDIPAEADHLVMNIIYQSVQAEPDAAVTELWSVTVSTAQDGTKTISKN